LKNIISYSKDIPTFKLVLGIVTIIVGLYFLISGGIVFGAMFTIIGLNLCLAEGSQIDLENKTYRSTKSVFGITVGKWKPIPKFEYVSVFKTSITQQINIISASARLKEEVIVLNLFYSGNKHITFYKTTNKEDAFKVANHFKLALDIDILDATEREKIWL
jgi:hypothetical protein